MRVRYVLLAATAVLAVTVAVPAFGGPSNPVADTFASAKKTAKKALKKANKANKKANAAQRSADAAQQTANGAQQSASNAKQTADKAVTDAAAAQATADEGLAAAGAAQASADAAQASADAAQSTANSKYGETNGRTGETSPSDSSVTKTVSVGCVGFGDVSGGGFILGGTGADEVTVTLSTQFFNGWLVIAREIGGVPATDNWTVTATAICVDQ